MVALLVFLLPKTFSVACRNLYNISGDIDNIEDVLRHLKSLDLLENFENDGITMKDLHRLDDPNDLEQLGISSDRALQLQKDIQQELTRRRNLHQTLKEAGCDELYKKLVETGYRSIQVVSMNHHVLKGIGLLLLERKNVLEKIENVKVAIKGNLVPFGSDE